MGGIRQILVALVAVALLATVTGPVFAQEAGLSYLIIAEGNLLPAGLAADVEAAGGSITRTLPEIGIAVVGAFDPAFVVKASGFDGVRAVVPDLDLQWIAPSYREALTVQALDIPSADGEFLSALQWGHSAVGASAAWQAGLRGDGVRVAVLDTGFDLDHVDLYPNVSFDLSANLTDETLLYAQPDVFSHGTHVAGIIAAADNGFGLLGVAPDAELVLTKVVRDDGSGRVSWLLEGIVRAVGAGADVVNLSLGTALVRHGFQDPATGLFVDAAQVRELANAIDRATTYAYMQGVTVISAAGDNARDGGPGTLPDDGLVHLPAEADYVLTVAATTPVGWATYPPGADFDTPTRYSNYGDDFVDFSAPGGDVSYASDELCEVGPVVLDCFVFDLALSTGSDLEPGYASYYWAQGTGVAAAYASGVAALIIGAHGGSLKPALVEVALRQSADDLGKPGNDDFFGHGRLNAGNYAR
jgi:subtilisin family serine protease